MKSSSVVFREKILAVNEKLSSFYCVCCLQFVKICEIRGCRLIELIHSRLVGGDYQIAINHH